MPPLDIQEISAILPHRYPMLMVDRIIEVTEDSVVGIKNVSINEPHFNGHFPGLPVMPGVLIIEAMAQVGGILISNVNDNARGKIMFLASVDEAKFRKPVVPGDQLRIEMKILRMKRSVAKLQGFAKVDGAVVAEAILMCKVAESEEEA
jgi:3-hydroxyacyl-[acyl-carrier-protein] dehydratase